MQHSACFTYSNHGRTLTSKTLQAILAQLHHAQEPTCVVRPFVAIMSIFSTALFMMQTGLSLEDNQLTGSLPESWGTSVAPVSNHLNCLPL